MEVACLDHVGYDTHVAQGTSQGILAGQLHSLGAGLAAFARDLGPTHWARTTVVWSCRMRGGWRRTAARERDHGRGGVLFVLGDRGRGAVGGCIGVSLGLAPAQVEGPGDLRVTTDYRNVLSEVLGRLGNPQTAAIFPGLAARPVGVVHG
ncbi:MAG: DUF1501 domain-containing protein [Nitrospira sp.]